MPASSAALRLSAWGGVATVVIALAGMALAGILPFPVGPSSSTAEVVAFYTEDNARVTAGLAIASVGICCVIPLVAAITVHLLRLEGRLPILSFIQLTAGAGTAVLLVLPILLLAIVAFGAPDRMSPETVHTLHDLAWLMFLCPIAPFIIQNLAIGYAVLHDTTGTFPRWLGFVNFLVAFSFLPDPLAFFFVDGPFAWDGVLVFYLAFTTYTVFLLSMTWAVRRANSLVLTEARVGVAA